MGFLRLATTSSLCLVASALNRIFITIKIYSELTPTTYSFTEGPSSFEMMRTRSRPSPSECVVMSE